MNANGICTVSSQTNNRRCNGGIEMTKSNYRFLQAGSYTSGICKGFSVEPPRTHAKQGCHAGGRRIAGYCRIMPLTENVQHPPSRIYRSQSHFNLASDQCSMYHLESWTIVLISPSKCELLSCTCSFKCVTYLERKH